MKVLLLDTAFAAAPIYSYLQAEGHEVWVSGNRENDLLARLAGEKWIEQDYSNIAAVQSSVEQLGIDRVVPGCTDVSFHTCSHLSLMKGVQDPPEVNLLLADKAKFRALCAEIGIRAPQVHARSEFPRPGKYICKPVDGYSGRGCSVFDGQSHDEVSQAILNATSASPSGRYLIEDYAEGQLHSCSGFIENGLLADATYVVEGSSVNPYAVDTSYVTYDVDKGFRAELEKSLERLASHLGLVDGLLHTQFILSPNGAFIIEVSRRCPGDLYPLLIEYSTGRKYAARYASYFVGGKRMNDSGIIRKDILRHTLASRNASVFEELAFNSPICIKSFFPLMPVGGRLLEQQRSRAGILFCEAGSPQDLVQLYGRFIERNIYKLSTP